METMAVGSMSLVASRVALSKVQDEDVKQFATFEVAEQETIADVLTSMMDPSKATGTRAVNSAKRDSRSGWCSQRTAAKSRAEDISRSKLYGLAK